MTMKNLRFSLTLLLLVAMAATVLHTSSCTEDETDNDRSVLSAQDSVATAGMNHELHLMHAAHDSMMATPHHPHQLHWDSIYHHHDSLFWHHHHSYEHEAYAHDDHHHSWVPYDGSVNHDHHYHHPYPDHHNDSLITVHNTHHHDNGDGHHPGHGIDHHQSVDSLHHQHVMHHP